MSETPKPQTGERVVQRSHRLPLAKAFSLMTHRERRNSYIVLGIFLIASVTMAASVASIYPFLLVLTRPQVIETNDWLRWAYEMLGAPGLMPFSIILGLATVTLLLMNTILQIIRVYMVEHFTQMRIHTISVRLLEVFMSQPMVFFLGRNTGDMAKGILNETREVVQQFFRPAAEFAAGLMGTISVVVVLLTMAPKVTIVALAIIIGSYALVYLMSRGFLGRIGVTRVMANSERYRISREALNGIKDIKIAGTEQFYLLKYRAFSGNAALAQSRANLINSAPRFLVEGVVFMGIVLVPLFFLDEAALRNGNLLSGFLPELGMMALGAQRLMPEVQKLYRSISVMRFGAAAVDSVYVDMSMMVDAALCTKKPDHSLRLLESLELRDICFTYPSAEKAALSAINIRLNKGERVGIVGTTGAGKSTLADLILGLLRPQTGEILVDGRLLQDDDIRAWQRIIGYVPQHIFLSDASVAENIALGTMESKIDRAKIEHAARIAQLHGFVSETLPKGYDTVIGENGIRLSGGQRQRIGVARALYRDTDLIVFDEATSALDSVTENELVSAIESLPNNKTIIVIAHRLSTVRSCDRIIVMKEGRIVSSGNWEENMRDCPDFQALVAQQNKDQENLGVL